MEGMKERRTKQELVIYRDARGDVKLRADMDTETMWATQEQIAGLFGIDRTVSTRHIGNILKDGEVDKKSNVQKMHIAHSDKPVALYSLDIILAVGYRTNSARAIMFRKWATKTLRDYIIKGYALNAKRLQEAQQTGVKELEKTLRFIQSAIRRRQLDQKEVDSLLSVIGDYANSWLLLQKYDKDELVLQSGKGRERVRLEYAYARSSIDVLKQNLISKGDATELFAGERDQSFQGILGNIYQTFGGKELYDSLEEKAAHLLYFIIKDHPFSDGNKRVGSFLFILFLERNGILYRKSGERKINDNALVALALLIAESNPGEKDALIKLVTNLLV